MRPFRFAALLCLTVLANTAGINAVYADPAGLVVAKGSGTKVTITEDELAHLPTIKVPFATDHGARQASFEGPLLWTILDHAGFVDAKSHAQVRQSVLITGSDGYTALLALGEISPEFEAKQVVLAEREDDKPLDPEHLRVIVPGDKRGGRSVHDVVSIELTGPGT
jgi:hypothetical protein